MFGNPDSRIERECEYSRTPGVCRHQESVRVSLRRGRTIVRPGLNLSLCVKRENQRIMAVSLATLMTSLVYRHAIKVCVTQSYQCESTLSHKYSLYIRKNVVCLQTLEVSERQTYSTELSVGCCLALCLESDNRVSALSRVTVGLTPLPDFD